jgi:DNA-binding transcriptional regulator YiaG
MRPTSAATKDFKAKLKVLNMSQKAFARLVGYSSNQVSHWCMSGVFPLWVAYTLEGMKLLEGDDER